MGNKTHTFTKKSECPKCHSVNDVDFEVTLPEELVVTKMHSSIKLKEPEQQIKQNQLSDGLNQQSKKEYTKGKLRMS